MPVFLHSHTEKDVCSERLDPHPYTHHNCLTIWTSAGHAWMGWQHWGGTLLCTAPPGHKHQHSHFKEMALIQLSWFGTVYLLSLPEFHFWVGLPWWLTWSRICLYCRNQGLIPGMGRSPGEGNGNPLQNSCLENPMDRGAWWATVHGVAKSRIRLSDCHFHFSFTLVSEVRKRTWKHSDIQRLAHLFSGADAAIDLRYDSPCQHLEQDHSCSGVQHLKRNVKK